MKIPKTPPNYSDLWDRITADPERCYVVFKTISNLVPETKYLHWDKIRHLSPPDGLSTEEWWYAIKLSRKNLCQVPLIDKFGKPFNHLTTEPIPEYLHQIDLDAGGMIQMPEQITNHETRDQYYISSLIQEAITSSQLEGATTTRRIAKEMIKSNRAPQDRSERMILNNYRTMRHIQKLKNQPLTIEMVFEIHNLVTEHTLDDPSATGRLRNPDEKVAVYDVYNEILHDPPPAEQLADRLAAMCDFANGKTPKEFIHPVVRSIILHFWLSYDHPFVD
ncbi:MAG: Fic family protein, partial [Anaerohalosphaera sp.]|nr:Fic family protein [Anaerohalosphaera sp.]